MPQLDLQAKLAILADAAKYDASCSSSGTASRDSRGGKGMGSTEGMGICHAYAPDGRCISLLKILLTNSCIFDCHYCINRKSSNVRRARFTAEEVVKLTLAFYKRNYIEGLFLSSGIIRSSNYTMEQLVEVARSLREDHDFRGYIHLKTIPDADPELVRQAGLHADRVSINVELPTEPGLKRLAPEKCATRIEGAMRDMKGAIVEARDASSRFKSAPTFAPAGQSTQMIVGADAADDGDIVRRASQLYDRFALRRVYYSAFSPIPDASAVLPLKRPPLMREHRLYQSDWLMRFYGFTPADVSGAMDEGMLPLDIDPKLAWALRFREQFPVDVNRAPREVLLRVPGLGTKAVKRILQSRRWRRLTLADVGRLTLSVVKVRPFIVAADWRPTSLTDRADLKTLVAPPERQLELFRSLTAMLRDGPMIDAHRVVLDAEDDFDGWREAARDLAEAGVPPHAVVWQVAGGAADLFGAERPPQAAPGFAVPRAFVDLARSIICHSDPERFALLYALLWRLRSNRQALEDRADPLVDRLQRLAKEVRRDVHKMHAFVCFRELAEPAGTTRFVAWFEPDHHIVRHSAGFFVRRFANMRWSILTPELSIHWDGEVLSEGPGATRADAPSGDRLEESWRTYYASIFNPARLKVRAMLKEMPKKYWRNMPETSLVQPLIASARARELEMIDRSVAKEGLEQALSVERRVQPGGNLRKAWEELLSEARQCTRCELYKCGTQTVFGEGPLDARILFVGEQPGDQEDLAGRPFVGPAGQLFDQALEAAGIDRAETYVTNAVKHFKFVQRGKRRIHDKPDVSEISACRWWQERERALIRPLVTVALGATAARSLFGKAMAIGKSRGVPHELPDGSEGWITVHPSFLLRIPEEDRRREERARFVEDLVQIRERAEELPA